MQNSAPPPNPASPASGDRSARGPIDPRRLLIDVAVGGGLLVALAIVFAIDWAWSSGEGDASSLAETVEVVVDEDDASPGTARPLRLAVTPPEYDDMGKLLDKLGAGYRYTQIELDDLLHAGRLAEYDVVFLTCGGAPRAWLERRLRDSERGDAGIFRPKPEIVEAVRESFRKFVGRGGTLYASDLQFDLVALAFPELVDDERVARGEVQTVEAEVVDAGLRRLLGPAIDLRFDMPAWRPAAFGGPEVTCYLRGAYRLRDGREQTGPLLVTFPHGEGMVIFTSFHNEAQNTEMERELLRYLVLATVTARQQERIERTMVRGGFSPAERNLLSASSASKPVRLTYGCRKRGPLQFVLGFGDQGAELRLTVVSPDGRRIQKQGTRRFALQIDDARPGTWQCTIRPIEVPFENFPYTLTIGEK